MSCTYGCDASLPPYILTCAALVGPQYHCMAAVADHIYGPYGDRYLEIPHAGHNMLFKTKEGQWMSTFFGSDIGFFTEIGNDRFRDVFGVVGDVDELFDDLIAIGVRVFNPFQPEVMDVAGIMEQYQGRLAFWGGVRRQLKLVADDN